MSAGYVRALFDEYAVRFERHLRRSLNYRGPELLFGAVRRACGHRLRDFAFDEVLDLGCGTGLAGEVFAPHCRMLAGVDLSPAMVARAEGKKLYAALDTGDLLSWLEARRAGSADLVLAADVLVYLGDLAPVMAAVRRVLRRGGLFACTIQSSAVGDVTLGVDHRYAHGSRYLDRVVAEAGLAIVSREPASIRQDRGSDVPGDVIVMAAGQAG